MCIDISPISMLVLFMTLQEGKAGGYSQNESKGKTLANVEYDKLREILIVDIAF